MLESQPSQPTKEKRFAYTLYLDLLALMVKLSETVVRRGGEMPLADNRFIKNVKTDDKLKSLIARIRTQEYPYGALIDPLADEIRESSIFKNYLKKKGEDLNSDVVVWQDIFDSIIAVNPRLNAIISRQENFSLRGVDRMKELMASTFTNFFSSQGHITDALRSLKESLEKARELYFRLLTLPVELTTLRDMELDEARHKYIVTDEDRNPNLRFVENAFVKTLSENETINQYVEKNKISWISTDRILLATLLKDIKESDLYAEYMSFPATDFHTDCEFWRNVYKQIIFQNPSFIEALEDKSVFWNDDIEIIGTFVLKTMKRFDDSFAKGDIVELDNGNGDKKLIPSVNPVMPMFKDEEDARFGSELFTAVIKNKEDYRALIDEFASKSTWDTERLAFMDVVVTLTALAELLNFPKIPTSVTLNEYIEIAKSYSTSKSGLFVHGLLGGIIGKLREEGRLHKQ